MLFVRKHFRFDGINDLWVVLVLKKLIAVTV